MPPFDPYSPGARAIAVLLRTAHLLAMAGFAGGVFAGAAPGPLGAWRQGAVASGAALLLTELTHGRGWAASGRGVAVLAHVGVLGLFAVGGLDGLACAAAVVIGSLGSHMPKRWRKWSFRHGRVVD